MTHQRVAFHNIISTKKASIRTVTVDPHARPEMLLSIVRRQS